MEPASSCSPHAEHVVDRPDVEAPRGVEPTGTNGRTRHTLSDSLVWGSGLVLWWFLSLDGKERCFLWSR